MVWALTKFSTSDNDSTTGCRLVFYETFARNIFLVFFVCWMIKYLFRTFLSKSEPKSDYILKFIQFYFTYFTKFIWYFWPFLFLKLGLFENGYGKIWLIKIFIGTGKPVFWTISHNQNQIRNALRTKMKIKLSVLHDSGLFASSGRVRKRKREGKFLNPRLN